MIPMVDLTAQHADVAEEIEAGLKTVLSRGHFVFGPQTEALEKEVAAYLGTSHAVGCASGTDALHLALRALGVGPGDEVITSPFTFFATAEAICYVGAKPVFVDIDPHTFNLDPTLVEAAITPATRALLPVHLFGQPAPMEALMAIADKHGLKVVEDCAQSFGATRGGRATGTFGAAGAFSFFPSKNLGGYGDGGMVTTDSAELATVMRSLRNHGSGERYHHHTVGLNSRLDEMQSVVLRAKLKRIDRYNAGRRRVAQRYNEGLVGLPGLVTPAEDKAGLHVYAQYTLLVPERTQVMQALQAGGVACAIHYPIPLHKQQALAADYPGLSLPVAESVAARCLSLPMYPELTDAQIDQVIEAVRKAFAPASA